MAEAGIGDVVSIKDIFYLFLFFLITSILFFKIQITKQRQFKAKIISIIIIIILCLVYFFPRIEKNFDTGLSIMMGKSENSIIAINTYIFETIYYLNFYTIIKDAIINYFSETEELLHSKNDIYSHHSYKNVKSILFLSDTIRAKELSIFGYKKPTTLELQNLLSKENGQIFAVQSKACYTSSYASINCILSLKGKKEITESIEGVIDTNHKVQNYANILGYKTTFVRAANTGEYNLRDGYKEVISDVHTEGATDYKFVPLFLDSIKQNKKQFIFGYVRGAHFPYGEFMEKQFEKFPSLSGKDQNAYDNKIVELDYTWSSIIKSLKNNSDPIFIIFTSDHGESLGEIYNGKTYILHSAEYNIAPPEQLDVPFIVYVNDKYKQMYPKTVEIIAKNLEKYQSGKLKISADVISHSLLNCTGADGNWIDKTLSICSSKFMGKEYQ